MSLSGKTLRTLLAVLEERSVTRAAARLGVTQSAVSHALERLREVLGDPLFLRSGSGVEPTRRALELRMPVLEILDRMKELTSGRAFDPTQARMSFVVAANDFQRELLFPGLLRELLSEGVDVRFRFPPSGVPTLDLLQGAQCDLAVTPFPPESSNILQSLLFEGSMVSFFDSAQRKAPTTLEDFLGSEFVDAQFPNYSSALVALRSDMRSRLPPPRVTVPNFGAIPSFLRGSRMITCQTDLMAQGPLQGFASAPLPFENPPVKMYMIWHRRDHLDPGHRWLRGRIKDSAQGFRRSAEAVAPGGAPRHRA
ncbi:MAG: LysR family transcriptional regulator [Acidobacteriota bacterium]